MILTIEIKNPFRAWAERREAKAAKAKAQDVEYLMARACMDRFQMNTNVVRGTDNRGRIKVGGSINRDWGDTIGIGFMPEGSKVWYQAHFSAARARLIAIRLIELADFLEDDVPDCTHIDRDQAWIDALTPEDKSYHLYNGDASWPR